MPACAMASWTLLLRECQASRSTLVFVSHDERLAQSFGQRLWPWRSINRATGVASFAVAQAAPTTAMAP